MLLPAKIALRMPDTDSKTRLTFFSIRDSLSGSWCAEIERESRPAAARYTYGEIETSFRKDSSNESFFMTNIGSYPYFLARLSLFVCSLYDYISRIRRILPLSSSLIDLAPPCFIHLQSSLTCSCLSVFLHRSYFSQISRAPYR